MGKLLSAGGEDGWLVCGVNIRLGDVSEGGLSAASVRIGFNPLDSSNSW
jgi:hypothetical protein